MALTIDRNFIVELNKNLKNTPQLIQVLLGPRQVGKTTGVLNYLSNLPKSIKSMYFTADEILSPTPSWLLEKWQLATQEFKDGVLVIDEIQRVPEWSQLIKKVWDQQIRENKTKIKLVLLGSSSLDIHVGLNESLAGRFLLNKVQHWNYEESLKLYPKMTINEFVTQGGYPGSYTFFNNNNSQWQNFIKDSIIEPVISRDILNSVKVQKPALLKQSFEVLMSFPAQEISLTKILGQLQESGNTDLVKRYIHLFESAYLLKSIQKYKKNILRSKLSSPKIIPLCGALIDRKVLQSPEGYGRAVEACVGACLIKQGLETFYWREGNTEVDFIVEHYGKIYAIEVKSGRVKSTKGISTFLDLYPKAKPIFITIENLKSFLLKPMDFF